MKVIGDLDFTNSLLSNMVIQPESDFPVDPIAGRIIFINKRVYICVEIVSGQPAWLALTNMINSYTHYASAGAKQWLVNHKLNTYDVHVQVYDADKKWVLPQEITVIDYNTVLIDFANNQTGTAVVIAENDDASSIVRPKYGFEYTPPNGIPLTEWVVPHNLGYMPIVRVFVGNSEILPESITHNTNNQTTITFTTPTLGIARFI
jgi:hypothetical protein